MSSRMRVVTYNLLHEFGASRLLKKRGRGTVPPWAKDRQTQAASLVSRLEPDVACFQEADESAEAAMQRILGEGFHCAGSFRNESLPPKDGCSMFVRKDRFEVLEVHQFRMRDTISKHFPEVEDIRDRAAGMTAAFWREFHEKLSISIALRLRPVEATSGAGDVCVATAHLYWDPLYPDLKLLQAFCLAKELESFAKEAPIVLAGDLNSTPRTVQGNSMSGVYGLLTEGSVAVNHPDHPVMMRPASGILTGIAAEDIPTLEVSPFKSAYREVHGSDEEVATNASVDFTGCLDYIFFRGSSGKGGEGLRVVDAPKLPTADELRPQLPLPSADHPSDHLPVVADFELTSKKAAS